MSQLLAAEAGEGAAALQKQDEAAARHAEAFSQLAALRREHGALQALHAKCRPELAAAHSADMAELTASRQQHARAMEDVQVSYREQLSAKAAQVEHLSSEVADLRSRRDEASAALVETQAKLAQAVRESGEASSKAQQQQAACAEANAELREARKELAAAAAKQTEHSAALAELESANTKLSGVIDDLTATNKLLVLEGSDAKVSVFLSPVD